jgi:hypothetical protein
MNAQTQIKAPINNTRELRAFLVSQMQGVADGKVNTEKAKGICNISQQIYNSLNLEVKMAVARSKLKDGDDVQPVSFTD